MTKGKPLEYLNFTCKFGDHLNLMDFAEEIILPAFFDRQLVRQYGKEDEKTSYFLHRPQVISMGQIDEHGLPVVAIGGRFVKKGVVVGRQDFDSETDTILPGETAVVNVPTAVFMLILNDHRLLYLKETPDAPPASSFGATMQYFIRGKKEEYLRDLQILETESLGRKPSLDTLRARIPKPKVTVLPLPPQEVDPDFRDRFMVLSRVTFRAVTVTNGELNFNGLFPALPELKKDTAAEDVSLAVASKKGLDKEKTFEEIAKAAAAGNIVVEYEGITPDGGKIKGDNEDIKLTVWYSGLTQGLTNLVSIGRDLYKVYRKNVDDGVVLDSKPDHDFETLGRRLRKIQRDSPLWNDRGEESPPTV